MNISNFDKLYTDFKNLFDICRYSDDALKDEILKRIADNNNTNGTFLFRFRLVIFKFEILNNKVTYIGYEK